MEIEEITTTVTGFFHAHPLLCALALAAVAFIMYKNPKESFKFLAFLGILAIAGYFVLQLGSTTSTGVSSKEEMIHKTKEALGE